MEQTIWSLVPPIIAIALALVTKEVYSSLLIGILSGALFFSHFNLLGTVETTFAVMGEKVGGNINIVIFLVLLGVLVSLMTKSGASQAYGKWANKSIKSQRQALLATSGLGALIFVDDYFNCLTVGAVMRPVTDANKVSRAKLAYIIDATAAPICIIAPISSWAAAVGSSLPEGSGLDGFNLFLQTIPFNFYALLTILMVLFLIISKFDFGPMRKYEQKHLQDYEKNLEKDRSAPVIAKKGKVLDLVVPIAVLIITCILGMLYTGGILEGKSVTEAFGNCDSALSLVMGSFVTLLVTFLLYIPRGIVSFREFMDSLVEGFRAMAPAILILTLAWTLSGICGENYLNAGGYVGNLVQSSQISLAVMPAVFFLVAIGLAFATGTSWGTFLILIPIVITVFSTSGSQLMVITIASVLAGAVCGDHISPISDTTILASTGADCNHIEHVATQMPYALIVAACCMVGYIVAGITSNGWLGLLVGAALLLVTLGFIYYFTPKKVEAEHAIKK